MPRTRQAVSVELDRRLCLRCGYRGRLLQGDRGRLTFTCPSCRCDLYARPARSYAEMEGLHESGDEPEIPEFLWSIEEESSVTVHSATDDAKSSMVVNRPSRMERTIVLGVVSAVIAVALARAIIGMG